MSAFEGLPVQSEDINMGNIRADRKLLWLLQLSVVLLGPGNFFMLKFCPATANQNLSGGESLPNSTL